MKTQTLRRSLSRACMALLVISILKSTISATLDLNNSDYALLISASMVPYTAFYLFSGRLIDRWGTRA